MATIVEQEKIQNYLKNVAAANVHTANVWRYYLKQFNDFLETKDLDIESAIEVLKKKRLDVYQLLSNFLSYLNRKNLSNKTKRDSVKSIRAFLESFDVEISLRKFKFLVKLPRNIRRRKNAIDKSDIVKILTNISNLRLQTFVHLLASTGMRAVEGLSIRLKDVDFNKDPPIVFIRGKYTKTKADRLVYLTKECAEQLRAWIEYKYRERERYDKTNRRYKKYSYPRDNNQLIFSKIFTRTANPESMYFTIRDEFAEVTDRIKLTEGKDRDDRRRKLTMHTFRDFVKSTVADAASTDYSEWFIGHAGSTYYNKKEIDRVMLFRKAEPGLTFFALLDTEEQQRKEMEVESLKDEVEKLRTYKSITAEQVEERAIKMAEDLARDRLDELIRRELPMAVKQEVDRKMHQLERRNIRRY